MNNLLKEPEAAEYLGMSRSFLRQSRMKGTGPIFIKLGRMIRYRLSDLNAFVESRERKSTVYLDGGV